MKPPATGVKPPATGVKPPATGVKPPATRVKPPATGVKPPATEYLTYDVGPAGLEPAKPARDAASSDFGHFIVGQLSTSVKPPSTSY